MKNGETEGGVWDGAYADLGAARERLRTAKTASEHQTVGLLCREALISAAQAVFDPLRHVQEGTSLPSPTDAKAGLAGYLVIELAGAANEEARRHAKAAVDLSYALQHKRTAGYRDGALCLEATSSTLNILAIVSGYSEREAGLTIAKIFSVELVASK